MIRQSIFTYWLLLVVLVSANPQQPEQSAHLKLQSLRQQMIETLRHLADTHQQQGQYREAANFLQEAVLLSTDPQSRQKMAEELVVLFRQLEGSRSFSLNITSADDPQQQLVPDKAKLNGIPMVKNMVVPTGIYTLVVEKDGYSPLQKEITIGPGENPYISQERMEPLPRRIELRVLRDFDRKQIYPDVFTIDDEIFVAEREFLPGSYSAKIEKYCYDPQKMQVTIPPGNGPYIIETILESQKREMYIEVTGEFPRGERVDPEITNLTHIGSASSSDPRQIMFKPGSYELEIQEPGYLPFSKKFILLPGDKPFIIDAVLLTKPRKVELKIDLDAPCQQQTPAKITIAPFDKSAAERILQDGEMLKPNSYNMKITKEGYAPLEWREHIWPDERPAVIKKTLKAEAVPVHFNIIYDVVPPTDLSPATASLIDSNANVHTAIQHGQKVKPGKYQLWIARAGYCSPPPKTIDILASTQPYEINTNISAQERCIAWQILSNNVLVPPDAILYADTRQPMAYGDTFKPGTTVSFILLFKDYNTVQISVDIVPGEGPQLVPIELEKLQLLEFNTREIEFDLDGIKYPAVFYIDGNKVEKHHIELRKGIGRWYCTLKIPSKSRYLRIYGGYRFQQADLLRMCALKGTYLSNIDIPLFIEHLKEVGRTAEVQQRCIADVMEKNVKQFAFKRVLRQCDPDKLNDLNDFLRSLNAYPMDVKKRLRYVIGEVEKLRE